jgi:hypothetical protein
MRGFRLAAPQRDALRQLANASPDAREARRASAPGIAASGPGVDPPRRPRDDRAMRKRGRKAGEPPLCVAEALG